MLPLQALMIDPGYIKARVRRGLALWKRNDRASAYVDLAAAVEADPGDASVVKQLRLLQAEMQRKGDAIPEVAAPILTPAGAAAAAAAAAAGGAQARDPAPA